MLKQVKKQIHRYITCKLLGHSRIVDQVGPELFCARCGKMTGDVMTNLGWETIAIIGNDHEVYRDYYQEMNWKDKIFVPGGFDLYEDYYQERKWKKLFNNTPFYIYQGYRRAKKEVKK